jgi:glycosyltransferase involved in cell wall biosynthesis
MSSHDPPTARTTPSPVRALFINSGILGQQTFARFIEDAVIGDRQRIDATQIVVTEGLSLEERIIRRVLCARVWPDGFAGIRNLDFRRYRAELNAGILARRRIRRLERAGAHFDVLHFHRQATAYASVDRMRTTPTIISIDCTQRCVVETSSSALETRTYEPNIRRDGAIFRAARLIISTSHWAADSVRGEYPDCTTDIAVMPNPVQLEAFDPAWIEERHVRAASTAGYAPRVLFMGGDFVRKGGYDLLAAWRDGRLGRLARLDLVTGWPIDSEWLEPGITVHADVVAHSGRWRTLWREADIFVLPTRDEAFGIVFQEAAAAGLPAIGTAINAVPELIHDGASGVLVARGDREALGRALTHLIASPDLRRTMGAHARRLVEKTADPRAYREALINALQTVAQAQGSV